ncbi:hypothetical protein QA641_38135 [Bradyrhizobium sp. CB1650]|uniref:hypothetical protein n=1 Tax=Bradyrhizobium sp. CB1650 TaxID=3039153 RepID=UPI002435A5A9|nr:hypothetical protein [Bradyrhizobium sp. CB1650]WGD51246.1 hypothetical protein QA641_38135 [Bradyrhizobium sp. CB1650]
MSDDATRYLRQAQDCFEEAQNAKRVADKEAWLKLGEEWLAMAASSKTPPGSLPSISVKWIAPQHIVFHRLMSEPQVHLVFFTVRAQ